MSEKRMLDKSELAQLLALLPEGEHKEIHTSEWAPSGFYPLPGNSRIIVCTPDSLRRAINTAELLSEAPSRLRRMVMQEARTG